MGMGEPLTSLGLRGDELVDACLTFANSELPRSDFTGEGGPRGWRVCVVGVGVTDKSNDTGS